MKNDKGNRMQPWTDDDLVRLLNFRTHGWEWDAIASAFGRTVDACRVKYNRTTVIKANESQIEAKKLSKNRTNWSPADINTLKNLHAAGYSLEEMAVQLQRTDKAVLSRMYVEGMMDGSGVKKTRTKAKVYETKAKVYATSKTTTGVSASTIFDYVKKLEAENETLRQTLTEIRQALDEVKA